MKKNKPILSAILFITSFFIYYPSLHHDFVWDDQSAIKASFNYRSFINSLKPQASSKKSNYYRPTIYLSYLIDSTIWDKNPFGYHLSNAIFNASVVVIIFWFVFYFFSSTGHKESALGSAFLTSALFMLHPIHVESVSWVSARTDLLCTLFLMLGLLLHIKSSSRSLLMILALPIFYCSMLSKELGIVFLPLILIMDYATGEIRKTKSYIKYLGYMLLLIVYFYMRSKNHVNITAISDRNVELAASSNFIQYLDILKVLTSLYYTYLYKLIIPVELNSFIYDVPKDTYYLIGAFLFLFLVSSVLIYSFIKNYPVIYISIFWILLTLGPSSLLSIIKMTPTSLAERYLYLPSLGYCIILGYYIYKGINQPKFKLYAAVSLVILICLYSVLTISRQKVWENNLALWRDASIKSENACLPHNNYGSELRKNGYINEAIKEFLYVTHPDIKCRDFEKALLYNNLGIAFADLGKKEDARKYFESAITNNQFYFKPHLNLGISYLLSALESRSDKDFEVSEYYLSNAVELNSRSPMAHHYLSITYFETGKYKLSELHAEKANQLGLDKVFLKDSIKILNELKNKTY